MSEMKDEIVGVLHGIAVHRGGYADWDYIKSLTEEGQRIITKAIEMEYAEKTSDGVRLTEKGWKAIETHTK